MSEKIHYYNLEDELLGIVDRKQYYKEIEDEYLKKGSISTKIRTIKAFLMTSDGRLYIQKRNKNKNENAGLYDKTVGGHMTAHSSDSEIFVVKEFVEELNIPVYVLNSLSNFSFFNTVYLKTLALFKNEEHISNFISTRVITNGHIIKQPQIVDFYIGYYDGTFKFNDNEASCVELIEKENLKKNIENYPDQYTNDLKELLNRYDQLLIPLNKLSLDI